jgi:PAS domain S-box-containing protein
MFEIPFVRNLVVGNENYVESWPLYKRVMLTGQLCLLSIFFSLVYLILDISFDRNSYLFAYGILIGGSIGTLILLRSKNYVAGRLLFLISGLFVIVLFSMAQPTESGSYLFYLVISVAALTMFGHDRLRLGISISALMLILFIAIYFGGLTFIEPLSEDLLYNEWTFGINFIIVFLLITMMIHYLITINFVSFNNIKNTERNLLQLTDELSESRNRFQLAIKGSSAGIWDWDAVNDKLYVSPLLTRILGYGLETTFEATQADFEKVIHPDDKELVMNHLRSHIKERTKFEVEFRLRHGNGDYIWVLDTGQAEWDKEGKPQRMVGSIVNISERKNAEKQIQLQNEMLEKANAELDRFVYSVSHDLKSPLSSVLGLMSIADMSEDITEVKDCIRMMRDRINALNGFIEEIINYSRNTRTDAMMTEVLIGDMVEKILDGLKFMDKMQSIRLQLDIDPELVICTDSSRLKIVLNNLIGNAVKYHNLRQDDPYIRIQAKVVNKHAFIVVQDNGQGIDESLTSRIFDMFFRAHEKSEGSGLGLYIAKEMILKLNGEIQVESKKNEGSTFSIKIPVLEMVPH